MPSPPPHLLPSLPFPPAAAATATLRAWKSCCLHSPAPRSSSGHHQPPGGQSALRSPVGQDAFFPLVTWSVGESWPPSLLRSQTCLQETHWGNSHQNVSFLLHTGTASPWLSSMNLVPASTWVSIAPGKFIAPIVNGPWDHHICSQPCPIYPSWAEDRVDFLFQNPPPPALLQTPCSLPPP